MTDRSHVIMDCSTCAVRGDACGGCVVTLLWGDIPGDDVPWHQPSEQRGHVAAAADTGDAGEEGDDVDEAVGLFVAAGMVTPLEAARVRRERGSRLSLVARPAGSAEDRSAVRGSDPGGPGNPGDVGSSGSSGSSGDFGDPASPDTDECDVDTEDWDVVRWEVELASLRLTETPVSKVARSRPARSQGSRWSR